MLPQAALLNSFPTIFDELLQMFTVQEVAEFVRGTLGSMPSTVHIGQSMDVVKLQSIARTVDSRLFSFSGNSSWDGRQTPLSSFSGCQPSGRQRVRCIGHHAKRPAAFKTQRVFGNPYSRMQPGPRPAALLTVCSKGHAWGGLRSSVQSHRPCQPPGVGPATPPAEGEDGEPERRGQEMKRP